MNDLKSRIPKLKLSDWRIDVSETEITVLKNNPVYTVPWFRIIIDSGLGFSVQVYDWFLPGTHFLYKKFKRSMRNITLSNLLILIKSKHICKDAESNETSGKLKFHVIPQQQLQEKEEKESETEMPLNQFQSKEILREQSCEMLITEGEVCSVCEVVVSRTNKKIPQINLPAKPNAPLKNTSHERVVLALKQKRLECNQLQKQIEKMRTELQSHSVEIDHKLNNDLVKIISDSDNKITPFMNLFWQQQKRLFQCSSKGVRFHPMIIRFCLSLWSKSNSVYEELRNSGILVLPSTRTLRDFKNYIQPKPGFRKDIFEDLQNTTRIALILNVTSSFSSMRCK